MDIKFKNMSNTKEKIKHLPINLFLSLGLFGISFSAFSMIQGNNYLSFFLGRKSFNQFNN